MLEKNNNTFTTEGDKRFFVSKNKVMFCALNIDKIRVDERHFEYSEDDKSIYFKVEVDDEKINKILKILEKYMQVDLELNTFKYERECKRFKKILDKFRYKFKIKSNLS